METMVGNRKNLIISFVQDNKHIMPKNKHFKKLNHISLLNKKKEKEKSWIQHVQHVFKYPRVTLNTTDIFHFSFVSIFVSYLLCINTVCSVAEKSLNFCRKTVGYSSEFDEILRFEFWIWPSFPF